MRTRAFFIQGGGPGLQGLVASGIIYTILHLIHAIYARVAARGSVSPALANP